MSDKITLSQPQRIKNVLSSLTHSQTTFDLIISHIPQAVFWKDRDSVYMGCNAIFAHYAGLSSPDEIIGKTDYDLPWTTEQATAYICDDQEVMRSNQPKLNIIERQRQADGKQGWVDTNKVPLQDEAGNVIGVLGTYQDFTEFQEARDELFAARQELEMRVEQRTKQLSTANAKLKQEIEERERIEDALRVSQERYALAVTAGKVGIWLWDIPMDEMFFDESLLNILDVAPCKQPSLSTLIQTVHPEDREQVRQTMLRYKQEAVGQYEQGYRVILQDGTVRWVLARGAAQADADGQVIRMTGSLTDITALKQAQEAERQQRTFTEALVETAKVLNQSLDLELVLDRILSEISRVVPHDTANIVLIDDSTGTTRVVRRQHHYMPVNNATAVSYAKPIAMVPNFQHMVTTAVPILINDTKVSGKWVERKSHSWVRSYLGAPIQLEQEVIGFINLNSAIPGFFTDNHVRQLQAFTEQAAIAIRNARLYASAQQLAILEERQRLARDLHDAVSQTLWTANLTADVLPHLWKNHRQRGEESLERLRRLTRGALAEMRTLLLELRPASLMEVPLGDLLHRLAEATMSRKKIDVQVNLTGHSNVVLPDDAQIAFYRIAQECLNNIEKHARARNATIHLKTGADDITLRINDDGRGFNLADIPSSHLGLHIINERATAIGAILHITSSPGEGTAIQLCWRVRGNKTHG